MVVWSSGDERLVRTELTFHTLMCDLDSPTVVRDPRAWGFTHGIRRPRLPFGVSGTVDAR